MFNCCSSINEKRNDRRIELEIKANNQNTSKNNGQCIRRIYLSKDNNKHNSNKNKNPLNYNQNNYQNNNKMTNNNYAQKTKYKLKQNNEEKKKNFIIIMIIKNILIKI